MFHAEPPESAALPDDQLSEALPKSDAAFSLTFVVVVVVLLLSGCLVEAGVQNSCGESGRSGRVNGEHPVVSKDERSGTATTGQLGKPFAQSSAFYVSPPSAHRGKR